MRRVRNLAIFGVVAFAVLGGLAWTFRFDLMPYLGINVDSGLGGEAQLEVPEGYAASVFAAGLAAPRFMAVSPDGVLFVAERGADRVVALPDRDGDGRAEQVVEVGAGFDTAHDVAFDADGRLLVAGETALYRVTLDGLVEADREVLVDDLPPDGHSTRTVVELPDGGLLLSIGSSCNVFEEEDARRATVQLLSDGELRPYMVGLRNAVGVWVDTATGRAWATNMGRDHLGDDLPPETM